MKEYYDKFNKLLDLEKRYECIQYIKELIETKKITIQECYENILGKTLSEIGTEIEEEKAAIWQEHIKTAIVRSVIECLYPLVYEQSKATNKKAIVLCPSEEFHDIGARMVADFLMLLGFNVTYIGSNTPLDEVIFAIEKVKPELVAISVTNYYNLVVLKDIVENIKKMNNGIKIMVGGRAFGKKNCHTTVGADYCAHTYEEIKMFVGDIDAII